MAGEKSTPSTAYPASASSTLSVPVPLPRSAIRAGAGGRWLVSSSSQAALVSGSASPWSGSWSNVAASASQSSLIPSTLGEPRAAPY